MLTNYQDHPRGPATDRCDSGNLGLITSTACRFYATCNSLKHSSFLPDPSPLLILTFATIVMGMPTQERPDLSFRIPHFSAVASPHPA